MTNLALSFHSSSSSLSGVAALSASSSSSSAAFDDSIEDSCSICLEPFCTDDPASISPESCYLYRSGSSVIHVNNGRFQSFDPVVTNCKHEYHLHCILEWSQRSLECPICGRLLVLSDPSRQELLVPVEAARHSRTRNIVSSTFTSDGPEHDSSDSDDLGSDEEIMQHLMVMHRDRYILEREGNRTGIVAPQILDLNSSVDASGMYSVQSTLKLGNNYPIPVAPSGVNIQPSGMGNSTTTTGMDVPLEQRALYSQAPSESPSRQNTSEVFAFPESIKSKFTAASARYKESITKSTQGLREKLLAHNSSVKELSKGVQREMNASIAGLARMVQRLELSTKKTPPSAAASSFNGGSSSTPFKGRDIQENVNAQPQSKDSMVFVSDLSPTPPSHCSSMVSSPLEVQPVQFEGGH